MDDTSNMLLGAAVAGPLGMQAAGVINGSRAAQKAQEERAKAAKQWQDYIGQQRDQAISLVGNPAAMAAHDQALHAQERQVQRQEELAKSINPALIEQGKQYMQLLQGQSAPALKNLQDQRALQRQQLVSQLHQQMGPGAETSSAGMQALNSFDQDTSNHLSQAQMQYTGMLGGMSLQAPGAMNASNQANLGLGELNQMSPQNKQAQLMAQFAGIGNAANEAIVGSAGAGQTASILQNQGFQQMGNNIMSMAGAAAGAGSMGKNAGTLGGDVQGPIDRSGGQLTQNSGPQLRFA